MMRFFLAVSILLSLYSYSYGQDTATVDLSIKEGYKKWTPHQTAGRFGIGMQKEFYVELGASRYSYFYNDHMYYSSNYYGAFEWSQPKNVYGFKTGYEVNISVLALALEAKYQLNRENYDFVVTPKIGFGLLGIVNILYGYNISFRGMPYDYIGHHQFSMVFNFNKKMFNRDLQKEKESSPPLPTP